MLKEWMTSKKGAAAKQYDDCFGVSPLVSAQQEIEQWFSSAIGQRILAQEQACLDRLLPEMFGYHLMQLSVLRQKNLFLQSSTSHQFIVDAQSSDTLINASLGDQSANLAIAHHSKDAVFDPRFSSRQATRTTALISEFENLPIASDSIDVALLHHALDYSANPHQLLREAARVVIPNGHIIVIGFNPFSLMGMAHPMACLLSASSAYRHHYLRIGRLQDWCKVLELDCIYSERGYYGLPLSRYYSSSIDRIGKKVLPLQGSFYMLVIRKNITPMNLMKKPWQRKKILPKWRRSRSPIRSSSIRHHLSLFHHKVD